MKQLLHVKNDKDGDCAVVNFHAICDAILRYPEIHLSLTILQNLYRMKGLHLLHCVPLHHETVTI
jgi:hypothetical protein